MTIKQRKGINMTKEINLSTLFKVLRSNWWRILIIAVVVAVAAACFTEFVMQKKYKSSIEFYIINASISTEYTSTNLLASAEYLANDYIGIINSDEMVNTVVDTLEEEGYTFEPKTIRAMLSSTVATTASTFSITVTTGNPELSLRVAEIIATEAPAIIRGTAFPYSSTNYYIGKEDSNGNMQYTQLDSSNIERVSVLRNPVKAESHSSPNLVTNTLLAAIVAAAASYAVILFRRLSDTTIRSEHTVKEILDPSITIIGLIPYWDENTSTTKY